MSDAFVFHPLRLMQIILHFGFMRATSDIGVAFRIFCNVIHVFISFMFDLIFSFVHCPNMLELAGGFDTEEHIF